MSDLLASIELRGFAEFVKYVENREKKLVQNQNKMNKLMLVELDKWIQKNFESEGELAGGWEPLALSTILEKAKIGKEKPLHRTGFMKTQWKHLATNEKVALQSMADYSYKHEHGFPPTNLPARKILPAEKQAWEIAKNLKGKLFEGVTNK